MEIIKHLTDFFELHQFLSTKGVPITLSSQYPRLCMLADEILEYYELPNEQMFYDILIEFAHEDTLDLKEMDFVNYKLKMASTKVQGGFYKMDRIPLSFQPTPIVSNEVWAYVRSHCNQHLSHYEFVQIENGIRLLWNYSKKEMLVSTDFIHATDQYLASVEMPYDRNKMITVVDLVLEYLDELGYWNGFPF
jgi:hypothetical protein